jgi:hypothetical protein
MQWDVSQAVEYLRDNAEEHSTGNGARYVREAIEAGGVIFIPSPFHAGVERAAGSMRIPEESEDARKIWTTWNGGVSVSKVGGKSGRLTGSSNASTNSSARTVLDTDLTPQQEAEAQRISQALKHAADADLLAIARLLAAKPDGHFFGASEFQLRDAVHLLGVKALQTALQEREKGATTAPAASVPTANTRPNSTGGRPRRS